MTAHLAKAHSYLVQLGRPIASAGRFCPVPVEDVEFVLPPDRFPDDPLPFVPLPTAPMLPVPPLELPLFRPVVLVLFVLPDEVEPIPEVLAVWPDWLRTRFVALSQHLPWLLLRDGELGDDELGVCAVARPAVPANIAAAARSTILFVNIKRFL